jgi:hypothetical protein
MHSHEAVGWDKKQFQEKRFEYLAQIGNLKNSHVIDLGSGLGDLYGYLQAHKIKPQYLGFELVPELVDAARHKYPAAQFSNEDFVKYRGPVDYVLISGTFNVRNGIPRIEYFEQIVLLLKKAFKICKKGVAVNFLNRDLKDWNFEFDAFLISSAQVEALQKTLKPKKFKNIIDADLEGEYTLHFLK